MTSNEIKALVVHALADWRPSVPEPGTTVGVPWSAERQAGEVGRLRAALVDPYPQRFALSESDDPDPVRRQGEAVYWVVAEAPGMYLWYDESTNEFGVAEPSASGSLPVSIGLRGDIVGSFSAW